MDYGHVFRDTWKVRYMDGKVTGTCKKGLLLLLLLLFIIVLRCTNRTKENGKKQNDNG